MIRYASFTEHMEVRERSPHRPTEIFLFSPHEKKAPAY